MHGCDQCYQEVGMDMAKLAVNNDNKQYTSFLKRNMSIKIMRLKLGKKLRNI